MNIKKYPLLKEIKDADKMYAHLLDGIEKKELLESHLDKTLFYFNKIFIEKDMIQIIPQFYKTLEIEEELKDLFNEMCFNVFYMHDIGKANINYQLKKMKNPYFKQICESNSDHSLLSSVIYIEYFHGRILESKLQKQQTLLMFTYMLVNAYIISKHHGHIKDFSELKDHLKTLYNEYMVYPDDNQFYACPKLKLNPSKIESLFGHALTVLKGKHETEWGNVYIYAKLVYSVLIACDFYATSDYINNKPVENLGNLMNIDRWKKAYTSNATYQSICKYKEDQEKSPIDLQSATNINVLRSEMFIEAYENLLNNSEQNLFYLEAPTGSGKTNTSIWLALSLLELEKKHKLFYVFPFNALVEQTKSALDESFKSEPLCKNEITVVNSITPIKDREKDDMEDINREIDYNQMVLDRQFFHYPLVITSHVQLFNLFFGTGRSDGAALYQLVNSVIILDEVQSYKNSIWTEIIRFLNSYAKLLNFKVIIMSATLPRLDKLLYDNPEVEYTEKEAITSLICDREKYFSHPLFKDRVELDFSLLNESNVYEKLMAKIIELSHTPNKKILVEFINKKSASDFYNDLVNRLQQNGSKKKVLLITGDDSKWEREKCIATVKDNSCTEVVLIATQLIEAGVDIDMDYGFKDISLLDSEEQFLGRINRSCKKSGCKAFFFNLDKADILYKGDHRKEYSVSLKESKMQDILSNKAFEKYYRSVFEYLRRQNKQYNKNNLQLFNNDVLKKLNFLEVKERMQLIEGDIYPYTVFLGIKIEITENGESKLVDGRKVWNDYMKLLCNSEMDYAEKKVKLSQLSGLMSCFMWQVKAVNVNYTKKVGGIFYIEHGEQYMKNGKFDREPFNK